MGVLKSVGTWFQGKKTILGGLVILAAAVAGVWYGKLDPVAGVTLAGAGLSVIGWGDKANRHQAELLTALEGVARVGGDLRVGNKQQAITDLTAAVTGIAPAAIGEAVSLGGASLHISGSTADEMASLAKSLLTQGSLSVSAQGDRSVTEFFADNAEHIRGALSTQGDSGK